MACVKVKITPRAKRTVFFVIIFFSLIEHVHEPQSTESDEHSDQLRQDAEAVNADDDCEKRR